MTDFEVTIYDKERKKDFIKVFGTTTVKIISPIPTRIKIPSGEEKLAYFLDLKSITSEQRTHLITHISERFNQPLEFVAEKLESMGVPILKEHCGLIIHNPQRWFN